MFLRFIPLCLLVACGGSTFPAVDAGIDQSVTTDLNARERIAMVPLVLLVLALGIYPKPMLDVITPTVTATMQHVGVSDPQPTVSAEGAR